MQALPPDAEAAVEELLLQDVTSNLFLLGLLDRWPAGMWYGTHTDGSLSAIAAMLPDLMVPYAHPEASLDQLATAIATHAPPATVVGPRTTCDRLIAGWGKPAARFDQQLYVIETAPPPALELQQATLKHAGAVCAMSAAMAQADFGREPTDPAAHAATVRRRIQQGRTWLALEGDSIVFTVNVGTRCAFGCQVGGTWVPPSHRGQGIASRAMATLASHLLQTHPRVTLHVREANRSAIHAYQQAGFRAFAPFRVALFEGG